MDRQRKKGKRKRRRREEKRKDGKGKDRKDVTEDGASPEIMLDWIGMLWKYLSCPR